MSHRTWINWQMSPFISQMLLLRFLYVNLRGSPCFPDYYQTIMVQGASFVDVFHELNKNHGFERRTAFTITMRTFRSGGLTKDAIYLRGLIQLLEYLKKGGALEPLFIGKIAVNHVAIIQELQWRKVLHPIPQLPLYLSDQKTIERLNNIRNGHSLINLI